MSLFEDNSTTGFLNDRIKKAEKRLEQNPYDVEAWSIIVRDATHQKIEDARPYYEKLVAQFPSAGRYWKMYIEHEMKSRNYERVEKLFTRCLVKVLNIDLWRVYLGYVKETKGSLPSYREKMAQAYDFALEKMGMDINSYPIWNDYIIFLKNVEAVGSYAENQRITAVRKVYQRGIVNPMTNIEQLWKDYVSYEQSINSIIADKMVQDRSRDYMNARRVAKEYEAVTRGLNKNIPSCPPQGLPEELKQVDLWKKYICWEKSNPLKTEDQSILTKRVMFAFEQCLLCLGHHPNFWYEAALFLESSSKLLNEKGDLAAGKMFSEEAAAIYERATSSFLKTNMLLHFAYADFEEGRMKYDKVHAIYNKFIENPEIDPTLAYIQYMKFARRAEGIQSARNIFRKMRECVKTKYHVFVAAAWMEYYCNKDKKIAFKIFELGLKKHGDNSDYVLSYIDYLSHLNDDNNTRVLFERVLSSGSVPPERQLEIWNKFLEFESNVGDLASILKVEKRRAAIIEQLKEFEGKETALLVDRYKFMDLFPCTVSELKAVGYTEINKQRFVNLSSESLTVDEKKAPHSRPDVSNMIPYKPRQICPTKAHPLPGGVFPAPPAASFLMTLLPPPTAFQGPFAGVDELLKMMKVWKPPETAPHPVGNGVSKDMEKYFEHAIKAMSGVDGKKRKIGPDGVAEESDDEDGGIIPPVKDVYRARQQKKVK